MKMNKTLLAILAMSSVASVAHADISILGNADNGVQFYGVLDAAVGEVQHSLAVNNQFPASVVPYGAVANNGKTPGSTSGLFNGGISDSRLGLKGSYDIGNDMKAFFVVEEGINVTTGRVNNGAAALASNGGTATTASANTSLDGQFGNRQANIGLSEKTLGSVALGRNYSPQFDIAVNYDPVQNAQLFSPIGFSGTIGGGGGMSENTRVDNSVRYANKFGAFNYGALYKAAGGMSGSTGLRNTGVALNGGYEEGAFGVQGAYEAYKDGVVGGLSPVVNSVAVTVANTSSYMIAAKYKITDVATVKAGYESITVSTASDNLTLANASYYGQAVSSVGHIGADRKTDVMWLGGDYNVTGKLNIAAGLYDVHAKQSADNAQKDGTARYMSLLADYHITKMLDTYAGLMHGSFSGLANAANYSTQNIVAAGVRFKF